jgi:hypothetical protein
MKTDLHSSPNIISMTYKMLLKRAQHVVTAYWILLQSALQPIVGFGLLPTGLLDVISST